MNPFGYIKRLVGVVFRQPSSAFYSAWRSVIPWYRNVSEALNSSTVSVTLMWVMRNFPEAPPALWKIDPATTKQPEKVLDHPMLRLLQRPNPYFSGILFWMATVSDWKADGNAYWLKLRDQNNVVAELWWIPSWLITPVGTADEFISYYVYTPNNVPLRVEVDDIVHFRFGIDPDNTMKGLSPLKSVLREVYTDDESARFTAALLTNMGVPGVVISPDPAIEVTDEDMSAAKDDFDEKFRGIQRGGAIFMKGATRVEQFGFSPEQMNLKEIRRIPEERVSSALGVPAIVVGFGAGLEHSTFTNMGEAMEYAYSNGVIPDQRIMADVVRWELLDEWEDDPFVWKFGFDLAEVRALQEDVNRVTTRLNSEVMAGVRMVSEHRRETGLPVDEERDNVFLRPANYTMVDADTGEITTLKSATVESTNVGGGAPPADGAAPPPAPPPPPPPGGGNGNGGAHGLDAAEIAQEVVLAIQRTDAERGDA